MYDFIRGLSPVPGAWAMLTLPGGKDTVLKIYSAAREEKSFNAEPGTMFVDGRKLIVACGGSTALRLLEVQLAGKKRMAVSDFLNGMKGLEGSMVK